MKSFDEFINEKLEFNHSLRNGKKIESTISAKSSSMNEFIKHIKSLPDTIDSIKVPIQTLAFNPKLETFKGPINSSSKSKIIKIIKDMTKEFKAKGDSVYQYEVSSYYGVNSAEASDPYYISFKTKSHDKFGKDMSSGKYGSLD